MAILIPTNAILRVVVKYSEQGQLAENVYFIRNKTNNTTQHDIALSFRDNVTRRWKNRQLSSTICTSIIVQEINPAPLDPWEEPISEAGIQTGDAFPQMVAIVVSMKTGLGGRRNRGRKYVSGIPATDEVAGKLSSTAQGNWQLQADAIMQNVAPSVTARPFELGIVHRTFGGTPVPISDTNFEPVETLIVQPTLGTMRSRIPGHGT